VKFRITDNLPDLSQEVYAEEISLLLPAAEFILPEASEQLQDGVLSVEGVRVHEGGTVRKSVHSPAGGT